MRWRRLLLWGLLGVLAAVVVLLSSPYWLPTGWLRDLLVERLERALPVKVTIGELSFRLGRGVRVRWRDVTLVSEAGGARLELYLESVEGEALLGGLLAGRLEVPEVSATSVRARLREGPQGLGPLLRRWATKVGEERRPEGRPGAPGRPSGRASPVQLNRVLISDLIVTLTDPKGKVLHRTAKIDAGLKVLSTTPLQIRFEAEAAGTVAQGRLTGLPGPQRRIQMLLLLRDLDLRTASEYMGFVVNPALPTLAGLLKEGRLEVTASREALNLQVAATVDHLEAGALSTTRVQVEDARLALRRDEGEWTLNLETFPIETGVFNLRVPETTPGATPLSLSGRRLSASLAGSARLAGGALEGSIRTSEPLRLSEAHLNAEGQALPLLSVAELEGSLQEARLRWTPGEPPTVALSGRVRFDGVVPEGLMARVPGALTSKPLSGSLQVALAAGALQAQATLRGGSLSFERGALKVEGDPWQAEAKFSARLSERRLQMSSARWSSPGLRVHLRPQSGEALTTTLKGLDLEGSGSVQPAERGWRLGVSGKVTLGPLSLVQGEERLAGTETVSLSGSAGASLGRAPQAGGPEGLTVGAAEARLSASGVEVEEALARLLRGWPERLGVRFAGEAEAVGRFDGRRWQVEASAAGRQMRVTVAGVSGGPLRLSLDGVSGVLEAGVSADGSEVSMRRGRVSSPLGEVSWRGVIRRAEGRTRLQATGRLSTDWSALGPQWEALTAALPEELRRTLSRFEFQGPFSVEDVLLSGPLKDLTVEARVNLTPSAVRFDGELLKAAGTPGAMPIRVVVGEEVRLEEVALELGLLPRVRVAGRLDRALTRGRFELTVDELEQVALKRIRPELAQLALSGRLSVEAVLEDLREVPSARARLRFDGLALELVGAERVRVEVDGTVKVTPAVVASEDLRVTVDGSTLYLSARLENYPKLLGRGAPPTAEAPGGEPPGEPLAQLQADLRAQRLDLTGLERALRSSARPQTPGAVVELTATADPRQAHPQVIPQVMFDREALEAALSRWVPRIVGQLAASGSVEVGEVRTSQLDLRDLRVAWSLRDGLLEVEVCEAGVAGGSFDAGGTQVRLDRWPPTYRFTYKSVDLRPTPFTTNLVAQRLPGLAFSGRMTDEGTLEGVVSLDPRESARSVNGNTRTTLTEGTLVGPLPAPEHVRRTFPKLNLAQYRFGTMVNEATVRNGLYRNSMLFNGATDIYILGTTDPEGAIDYELGLSLLRTLAGPASGLAPDVGRLPLMHFTGRVRNARFVELKGSFVSPPELVAKLLTEGLYRRFKVGVLDLGYLRGLERKFPIPGLDLFINGLDFVLDITIRLIPGLGKEKPKPEP